MQRCDRLRAIYRPPDPDAAVWPERRWIDREGIWEVLWPLGDGTWMCQIEPQPPAVHPGVFVPSSELEVLENLGPLRGLITAPQ